MTMRVMTAAAATIMRIAMLMIVVVTMTGTAGIGRMITVIIMSMMSMMIITAVVTRVIIMMIGSTRVTTTTATAATTIAMVIGIIMTMAMMTTRIMCMPRPAIGGEAATAVQPTGLRRTQLTPQSLRATTAATLSLRIGTATTAIVRRTTVLTSEDAAVAAAETIAMSTMSTMTAAASTWTRTTLMTAVMAAIMTAGLDRRCALLPRHLRRCLALLLPQTAAGHALPPCLVPLQAPQLPQQRLRHHPAAAAARCIALRARLAVVAALSPALESAELHLGDQRLLALAQPLLQAEGVSSRLRRMQLRLARRQAARTAPCRAARCGLTHQLQRPRPPLQQRPLALLALTSPGVAGAKCLQRLRARVLLQQRRSDTIHALDGACLRQKRTIASEERAAAAAAASETTRMTTMTMTHEARTIAAMTIITAATAADAPAAEADAAMMARRLTAAVGVRAGRGLARGGTTAISAAIVAEMVTTLRMMAAAATLARAAAAGGLGAAATATATATVKMRRARLCWRPCSGRSQTCTSAAASLRRRCLSGC